MQLRNVLAELHDEPARIELPRYTDPDQGPPPMNIVMESEPRKHLITVEEYYRMGEVGLFAPDARVELIEGEIIDMVPIGSPHNSAVNRLSRLFHKVVGDLAIVQTQGPVRLNRRSEPVPDVALLRLRADEYSATHPAPEDVLLIVEVSDSTLRYDRNVKVPLYARHGIPEVWIVDLKHDELLVHRRPEGETYLKQTATKQPGNMKIAALSEVQVDLSKLLAG